MKKATVIIPCHPRNRQSLDRTLDSISVAKSRFDGETQCIVVEDNDARGPSWARNRGLEQATGDCIFFADADDEVEPDFFAKPFASIERNDADMCFFTYSWGPALTDTRFIGNDNVRRRFLPAFYGCSFDDVRRWNAGGNLTEKREMGQVWRCAFRRDFIERNAIRFDEKISFYEDAAFLSECVALADCVATIPDKLYRYNLGSTGILGTSWHKKCNWEYKFLVEEFRERLDARCNGELWQYCEGSVALSALELLKARHRWREFIAQQRVHAALKAFPISPRHPLTAVAVLFLRAMSRT